MWRTNSHIANAPLSVILDAYDDALYQFCPSLYDDCSVSPQLSLDAARLRLHHMSTSQPSRTPPGSHLLCFKATADIVQVQTDAGMQEYKVPATHAQRERAPDAIEWRKADEAALQVLLNTPSRDGRRNILVPVTKPQRLGQPLLHRVPSVFEYVNSNTLPDPV
ncbi:hypothetical protein AB1Y20_003077 [Prymnesium parvum]|uniref:Uncharacterized protein n=1 Tax=Prymnesium parvum TaxID=97485 RepID=A0AB34JDJ0_PRYPA